MNCIHYQLLGFQTVSNHFDEGSQSLNLNFPIHHSTQYLFGTIYSYAVKYGGLYHPVLEIRLVYTEMSWEHTIQGYFFLVLFCYHIFFLFAWYANNLAFLRVMISVSNPRSEKVFSPFETKSRLPPAGLGYYSMFCQAQALPTAIPAHRICSTHLHI